MKAMFTLTIFEILLFKGRWVLSPAQKGKGSKSVNKRTSVDISHVMVKNYKILIALNKTFDCGMMKTPFLL